MIIKREIDLLATLYFLSGRILDLMADADYADVTAEIQITERDGGRWIQSAPGLADSVVAKIHSLSPLSEANRRRVASAIDSAVDAMDLSVAVLSAENHYDEDYHRVSDMAAQAFGFKG